MDELQVLSDEEEHAEHGEEHEGDRRGSAREALPLEEAEVEHGMGVAPLPEGELSEHHDGESERGHGADVGPAPDGRLDDPVEQGGQADDREDGADRVEGNAVGVAGRGHEELAADEGDGDDREIDEEDRTP